jgi:hypothetical protein
MGDGKEKSVDSAKVGSLLRIMIIYLNWARKSNAG